MNLKAPALVADIVLLVVLLLAIGCRPQEDQPAAPGAAVQSPAQAQADPQKLLPTPPIKSSTLRDRTLLPTPTLRPQASPVQLPTTATANLEIVAYDQLSLPTYDDSAAKRELATALPPSIACDERTPGADLHALVTKVYGISSDFAPDDLVPLAGHVPYTVTVGYPTEVRQAMLQPLVQLIDDMLSEGLRPQVLSGYRSYAAQAISWNKWNTLYPERASIISAQPGHSEHQLGTVIDFGSPELPGLVGQAGIQFHTLFYKTSEGQWLAANAHKYGFTLSFTEEAFDTTGFYYEPWHFRYVGQTMAEQLREQNLTLTEYQLANEPPPCTP